MRDERAASAASEGSAPADGPWTLRQMGVLALCALAVILDGLDTQVVGFAAPALIAGLKVTREALAPMLAVGLVGMMIGTGLGGIVGDRMGRRALLIGSMAAFGACTAAMSLANDLTLLFVFRFLAGIGLGGALPGAAALVSEFTPARWRSLAVTLSIVCVPLGGVAGGLLAGSLLPAYGWRGLFLVSGLLPVLVAIIFVLALPESSHFLEARRRAPGDDTASSAAAPAGSILELFKSGLARDTFGIWLAFFCCLAAVYLSFNWLPAMMVAAGFSLAEAGTGLLAFNIGGVALALCAAAMASFTGSRTPLLIMTLVGCAGAALLYAAPLSPGDPRELIYLRLAIEGGCIAGLQTILYALAANIYPTRVRATGIGTAASVGRVGAILVTLLGGYLLSRAGAPGFYAVIGLSLPFAAIGIMMIRRHIAPSSKRRAAGHRHPI